MDREDYMQKFSNMKCQRVQVDESFVPALQDDVMEVEHLLAEPSYDHVSVDGVLYYPEENVGKACDIENFSGGFDFGLKANFGGLGSHTTLDGKYDLKLEVLDGILDDVGIDDLNATDGFSSEDFLFDFEFADKTCGVNSRTCEGLLPGNSSSDSQSPGLSGSSINVGRVSKSSKVPISECECKNNLDERETCELHSAFRNSPCQPSKGDCMYQNTLDIGPGDEFENDVRIGVSILSREDEKVSVEAGQTAALREKRSRKRTQRYIDEFSSLRSKEKISTAAAKNKQWSVRSQDDEFSSLRSKEKISTAAAKNKQWSVRSQDALQHIKIRALRKMPVEKSLCGTNDLTLSQLRVCKGRLKKEELESEEEPLSSSESEDEHMKTKKSRNNDRRKHQRMWTLSEVNKLVDGISDYGVGRWTDIKRVLFPFSSYRTPIDLRDKWRNLLRASCALKFNKKEDEQKQDHGLRSLPISVLRRVHELAKIHPYPRQRCSKKSSVGQVGSSAISTQSKTTWVSLSKRNVRSKKCN